VDAHSGIGHYQEDFFSHGMPIPRRNGRIGTDCGEQPQLGDCGIVSCVAIGDVHVHLGSKEMTET
jgi:hypothetical protein